MAKWFDAFINLFSSPRLFSRRYYCDHLIIHFGDNIRDAPFLFLSKHTIRITTSENNMLVFTGRERADEIGFSVTIVFRTEEKRQKMDAALRHKRIDDISRSDSIVSIVMYPLKPDSQPHFACGLSAQEESRLEKTHYKNNGTWCKNWKA